MNNTQEIGNSVLQDFEVRILEYFDSYTGRRDGTRIEYERSRIEYLLSRHRGVRGWTNYNSVRERVLSKYYSNIESLTQSEKTFILDFITELFVKREWFPKWCYTCIVYRHEEMIIHNNMPNGTSTSWNGWQKDRSNSKILYYLVSWISNEFLKLWISNRKKGESYLTTIKRISECETLRSNPNYLIDICKTINERKAIRKIHLKFCKENNIKLKENIIKTLREETPKISKLEKSISDLKEELKKKEAKLKEAQDKIDEANYMKFTLLFPSVCKDIYSIFSETPSLRKQQIFKYPNDTTIRVISILLDKRSKEAEIPVATKEAEIPVATKEAELPVAT